MDWKRQLFEDLRKDEGFREYAYPDPLSPLARRYKAAPWGYKPARAIIESLGGTTLPGTPWTVGYGFTRGVTPDSRIDREEADRKLMREMEIAIEDARDLLPSFDMQHPVVKTVVANMSFNMGKRRFGEFRNTLAAFDRRDYQSAALGMMNSLWYKQVGRRARKLVKRVQTLTIEPENRV